MYLHTIRSRDGRLLIHGTVTWRNNDEFGFIPQGKGVCSAWWCKLDFWELMEGEVKIYGIVVRETDETAA